MWFLDGAAEPRRSSSFNADILGELELREPQDRHVTVDGRDIQGWFIAAAGGTRKAARPLVTEDLTGVEAADALRLVADVGVPGPRRRGIERLLLEPAGLGGLSAGLAARTTATGPTGR